MSSDAETHNAAYFAVFSDARHKWDSTQVREPEDADELMDWYLGVLEEGT